MNRRGFLTGVSLIVAAPAIVRVANIMPVKSLSDFRWQQPYRSIFEIVENPKIQIYPIPTINLRWIQISAVINAPAEEVFHTKLGSDDTRG